MFSVTCPHCNEYILIESVNCAIFRHGVFKQENGCLGNQIPPHLNKELCDNLKKNNLIYGCGKPFKLVQNDNIYKAVISEYI